MNHINFIVKRKSQSTPVLLSILLFISVLAAVNANKTLIFAFGTPTVSTPASTPAAVPEVLKSKDELAEIAEKFKTHPTLGLESLVHEKDSNAIRITLSSDTFFELGSAKLEANSISSIQEIVEVLKPLSAVSSIEIEGHTDDSPVIRQRVNYPSNWELSAARAASLIPLFINGGYGKDQLKVSGFGDSHPLFPNELDNRSNAKNRRIVLRVFKRG